jgi:hypothetical protein
VTVRDPLTHVDDYYEPSGVSDFALESNDLPRFGLNRYQPCQHDANRTGLLFHHCNR